MSEAEAQAEPETIPEVAQVDKSETAPESATKHGQGLRALVEARRHELEGALGHIRANGRSNGSSNPASKIEEALAALDGLLTGDLDNISEVTAVQLNQWIETSKYLTAEPAVASPPPELPPTDAAPLPDLAVS